MAGFGGKGGVEFVGRDSFTYFFGGEKTRWGYIKLEQLGDHDLSKYFGMLPHSCSGSGSGKSRVNLRDHCTTDYTDPGGHCLLETGSNIPYKKWCPVPLL